MISATVLWLWCLPGVLAELMSALEVLQFQENMKAGYRLSSEDCKRDDGIPLAIGLMRENPTIAAKNMDKKQSKGTEEEEEEGLDAAVEKKGEVNSNDGNGGRRVLHHVLFAPAGSFKLRKARDWYLFQALDARRCCRSRQH